MEEEFDFVMELEQLMEGKNNISFKDDLYDIFEEMLNSHKPVAIHCIPLSARPIQQKT